MAQEEAQKDRSAEIRAIAPVKVATYLLNEKRRAIAGIESKNTARIVIVPNADINPFLVVITQEDTLCCDTVKTQILVPFSTKWLNLDTSFF